jgi:hypothetical protein
MELKKEGEKKGHLLHHLPFHKPPLESNHLLVFPSRERLYLTDRDVRSLVDARLGRALGKSRRLLVVVVGSLESKRKKSM